MSLPGGAPTVRLARATAAVCLQDGDGRPVLPIVSPREEVIIEDMSRLLDVRLVWTDATEIMPPRPDPHGTILAIGSAATRAAALLSSACHKGYRVIVSFDGPLPAEEPVVILAPAARWKADLHEYLERIEHHACRNRAPSLLLGRDEAGLCLAALKYAVAWQAAARNPPVVLEYDVDAPGGIWTLGPGRLGGGRDTPTNVIRALLAAGADLVSVTTHSDGIDASLGAGMVLCGLKTSLPMQPRNPAPPCVIRNHCHRLDVPIRDVMAHDDAVSCGMLRSRVLLLDTCSGLRIGDDLFDQQNGLALSILEHSPVAALVTQSGLSLGDSSHSRSLVDLLLAGWSLSEAVLRYNRTAHARALGRRFMVCGCADLRIAERIRPRRFSVRRQPRFGSRTTVCSGLSTRLNWLKALINVATSIVDKYARRAPSILEGLTEAGQILDAALACSSGSDGAPVDALAAAGTAVLAVIPRLGRHALTDLWETSATLRVIGRGKCPHCMMRTRLFRGDFDDAEPRWLAVCNCCGLVADDVLSQSCPVVPRVERDGCIRLPCRRGDALEAVSVYGCNGEPADILSPASARVIDLGTRLRPGPWIVGYWSWADARLAVSYARLYKN